MGFFKQNPTTLLDHLNSDYALGTSQMLVQAAIISKSFAYNTLGGPNLPLRGTYPANQVNWGVEYKEC